VSLLENTPSSDRPGAIPAFLSIDVEPNGFQLASPDPAAWTGYAAMLEFSEQLRAKLSACTGTPPRFGWYFRTDPQIAEVYGRADHVMVANPARLARLAAAGDYFGVHMHPIRWCPKQRAWIHDFDDARWLARTVRASLEAYAGWAGEPARRFRGGAGFLSNGIIEELEAGGVEVDLTLEPVASWGLEAVHVPTSIDASPVVGRYTDCRTAPHRPFRPAHRDFRVSGGERGRGLVMVPLSTRASYPRRPLWRRVARRLSLLEPERELLYPAAAWPSPRFFWDRVEEQLQSMPRPYLALAIRTDHPELREAERVRRIFDALPEHPLASCLLFVDPLEVASSLVA